MEEKSSLFKGAGLCEVQNCKVGQVRLDVDPALHGSTAGRHRCIRWLQCEMLLESARAAGPMLWAEIIRRGTPSVSSLTPGPSQCWAWEQFLVSSGIGREVVVEDGVERFVDPGSRRGKLIRGE